MSYFKSLDPSMSKTMNPTSWGAIMSYLESRNQDTNQLQDYSQGITDWFTQQRYNPVKTDWQRYGIGDNFSNDDIDWGQLKEFFDFQGVDNNPYSIAAAFKNQGLMRDDVTIPDFQEASYTPAEDASTATDTATDTAVDDDSSSGMIDLGDNTATNVTIGESSKNTSDMGPFQEATNTSSSGGGGGLSMQEIEKFFNNRMQQMFSNPWTPYGYGWGGFNTQGASINKSQASKIGTSYGGNKSSFNRDGLRISNNNY